MAECKSEIGRLVEAAILKERSRVVKLLDAHEQNFKAIGGDRLYTRLRNLLSSDTDLDEEMKLPPEDRAMGFTWPGQE